MRRLKFLFRLSLIANIVLVVWALSQRARISAMQQEDEADSAALDRVIAGMDDNIRLVKDEVLRTIASNEQLDAFLAERRN